MEKWEYFSSNKYNLFQKKNLAVKSEVIAKKFYTVARHLHLEPALVALLENWLEKKDRSRFCHTHLDSGALYKLEAQDHLAIVSVYASGDLQTCVYVKKFIDNLLGNHKLSPGSSWSKLAMQTWKHQLRLFWIGLPKVLDVAEVVNSGMNLLDILSDLYGGLCLDMVSPDILYKGYHHLNCHYHSSGTWP
jgi:hypothetical protein